MKKTVLVLSLLLVISLATVSTVSAEPVNNCSTNHVGIWSPYWLMPLYMTMLSHVLGLYTQVQMKMAKGDDPLVIAPPMSLEVVQGYIEEASIGGNYVYRLGMLIKAKYWLNQILAQMS